MQFGNTPARPLAALGIGLALLFATAVPARAADPKPDERGKRVTFKSSDGVDLVGSYYAAPKEGKKDACVLLLHDFSKKTGGDSHVDDLDTLAVSLNDDGFAVLSFDFRGHGESKNIGPDVFWSTSHNRLAAPSTGFNIKAPPTTIDAKTFPAAYYPHLIDDVSGAKAFLDRKTAAPPEKDTGKINSANLIVIGSGQGAAIGEMWLFSQYRLRRQVGLKPNRAPDYDEPEGKDIACAVWLTPTAHVEGMPLPHKKYLDELETTYKVPMLYVYGEQDAAAKTQTLSWLQSVMPTYKLLGDADAKAHPVKALKFTRDWEIKGTKLAGSKLLGGDLPTIKTIKLYVDQVLDERVPHEPRKVDVEKFPYAWVDPLVPGQAIQAKAIMEEKIKPIPLRAIYMGGQ